MCTWAVICLRSWDCSQWKPRRSICKFLNVFSQGGPHFSKIFTERITTLRHGMSFTRYWKMQNITQHILEQSYSLRIYLVEAVFLWLLFHLTQLILIECVVEYLNAFPLTASSQNRVQLSVIPVLKYAQRCTWLTTVVVVAVFFL